MERQFEKSTDVNKGLEDLIVEWKTTFLEYGPQRRGADYLRFENEEQFRGM